jgi:predicted RNA-binding Zn-ribbon protein involved in translation (DUF1610 family)
MIVNGFPLHCPHCGGDSFDRGRLPWRNSSSLSLFGVEFELDSDNPSLFTCTTCGRIELFRHARNSDVDLRGKTADCTRCGTLVPADAGVCPNCGEPK